MVSILLCSKNQDLFDKCQQVLSSSFPIKHVSEFSLHCIADVIILDTDFVDNNDKLLDLIQEHPAQFLLAGSQWSEDNQVNAILHSVSGYFDINEPAALLEKAVKCILQGDIWVQRHLVPRVISALIAHKQSINAKKSNEPSLKLIKTLSNRELAVADRICSGESNKQIARTLNISERTVKAHLTSIFRKLEVPDRLHLALFLKEVK